MIYRLEPPKVSWLMCTNVYDLLLCNAIESCLNQTYDDFELIIVVNGCDRLAIFNKINYKYGHDLRIKLFKTPIQLLNFRLNLGLHHATGQYIARMDSDDISYRNRLFEQVQYLDENPEVIVVCSSFDFCDDSASVFPGTRFEMNDFEIRNKILHCNPICHPSVMFRAKEVCSIGGYLGGKHAEDYDLWVRIAAYPDWRFHKLPQSLIAYNINPNGSARKSRAAYSNMAAVQLRGFLISFKFKFLYGLILSVLKSVFFSRRD
jgi:glycosyltransferase involved in cell wall biosynthesis